MNCQWAEAWGGPPCTAEAAGELVWTYLAFRAVQLCEAHLAQEMTDEAREWLNGRGALGYHPEILDGARGWPRDPLRQPGWKLADHPRFQAVTAAPYSETVWADPRANLSGSALPSTAEWRWPEDKPVAARMGYQPQPPQTGTPPRERSAPKPPEPPDPWHKPGAWEETAGWKMCEWQIRWPHTYACPNIAHYRRTWHAWNGRMEQSGLFCEAHRMAREEPPRAYRSGSYYPASDVDDRQDKRLLHEGIRDRRLLPPPEPVDPWPWMQSAAEDLPSIRANTFRFEHAIGVRFKHPYHQRGQRARGLV
jgi:hypothetical protein